MAYTWIINKFLWFLRSYISYVTKDIFAIDKFEYNQENGDVYVHFHISSKRSFSQRKKIEDIVKDNKLVNSFSRIDAMKIGQLYGRSQERKRQEIINAQPE